MKAAMKAKDKERLGTIRLIQAEFKRIEVDERVEIDDARALAVLDKMVKQRRDSAQQYLDALLRGQRRIASQLVLDSVEQGTNIRDVYLHVFQRSQYEIGRLWQMNRITVAQEHYCTAATQLITSQLYPHLFSTDRIGRRLVATCVGDELHELGVRMVADFFEMEGWDTYYVGANAPIQSIVQVVAEHETDVLGISATMTFHLRDVASLIAQVRKAHTGRDVTILVGGYPFNVAPDLWRELGADGHARDAEEAVGLANQLLEGR
jgi:methylmalonyl-CoA mutase cobalamin-binding domain/chain